MATLQIGSICLERQAWLCFLEQVDKDKGNGMKAGIRQRAPVGKLRCSRRPRKPWLWDLKERRARVRGRDSSTLPRT